MTRSSILFIKSLRQRSVRATSGLFVVEGDKAIAELLSTPLCLDTLFSTERSQLNTQGETITDNDIARLSSMKTPPASLALFKIPTHNATPRPGLKLALDGIQDPGNLGTIIRIADWFGVEQIFCSLDSADCYGSKVVQASMGAVGRVAVNYCSLPETLLESGETVYGTFLEGGKNIYQTELLEGSWLVLGSEGRGISPAVERVVGARIFIPSYGTGSNVESLNVGVACGIAVSEFRRTSRP